MASDRCEPTWVVPLLAAFAAGCAAAPPVAVRRAEPAACPALVDVAGILARHANGFGSPAEVEAALPRSFDGELELQGRHGSMELVLDRGGRYGSVQAVDGMVGGDGIDDQGPWGLDLFGVAVRLRDGEAQENAFTAWMNRRGYLESFDALRDSAVCAVQEGTPSGTQLPITFERQGALLKRTLRLVRPLDGEPEASRRP